MKKTFKIISLSLALILCSAFLIGVSRFDNTCDELRDNVLRLHILANSDTDIDQNVKLKVRDAVLKECDAVLKDSTDIEDAVETAKQNTDKFVSAANSVLAAENCDYSESVSEKKDNYTTRNFDKFTLTAGEYNSVVVSLGEGAGKNWWCIMYPSVCLSAAGDLSSVGTEPQEVAQSQEKYIVKFWIVELYEKILNIFEK